MIDKRPDQCQRCGTLGADGNRMEPGATRWHCGRCGHTWTTQESPRPAITLAELHTRLKQRIQECHRYAAEERGRAATEYFRTCAGELQWVLEAVEQIERAASEGESRS